MTNDFKQDTHTNTLQLHDEATGITLIGFYDWRTNFVETEAKMRRVLAEMVEEAKDRVVTEHTKSGGKAA